MEVISVPIEKIRTDISSIYKTPHTTLVLPYLLDGNEPQTSEIAEKVSAGKLFICIVVYVYNYSMLQAAGMPGKVDLMPPPR